MTSKYTTTNTGLPMLLNIMEHHKESAIYKALFGKDAHEYFGKKSEAIADKTSSDLSKIAAHPDKIQHLIPYSCKFDGKSYIHHTFHRNSTDVIKVKQLIIEYAGNPFDVGIDYIEIEIGSQVIEKIPYFIIEAFETIKSYNTEAGKVVKIDLDLEKYIGAIQLVALAYHDVKFHIQPKPNSQIKSVHMICDSVFYCNEDRRRLNYAELKFPIHQFEQMNVASDTPRTTHKFTMSSSRKVTPNVQYYTGSANDGLSGVSQGLFINSTSPIKSVALIVNNAHTIIDYDEHTLQYIGRKCGPNNLLFIPFSSTLNNNANLFNFNNYKCAFPFSRVDLVTAIIETEQPTLELEIASMSPNIQIYKSGMLGLLRGPNFITNVKSEEPRIDVPIITKDASTSTQTNEPTSELEPETQLCHRAKPQTDDSI